MVHAVTVACANSIRISTPVSHVAIKGGLAIAGVTNRSPVTADAVIRTVPAPKAAGIILSSPERIRRSLGKVSDSRGCCLSTVPLQAKAMQPTKLRRRSSKSDTVTGFGARSSRLRMPWEQAARQR